MTLLDDRDERRMTAMLGTHDRSISASRTIRASSKVVLAVIGRVFTAAPYHLTVRETVNGHPLDGGILRFDVPNLYKAMSDGRVTGTGYMGSGALIYRCSQLEITVLNVTLKARGNAANPECEVFISGDLRDGFRKQRRGVGWAVAGTSTGFFGGALPIAANVIGSLAVAVGPAIGIAALAGIGALYGYRAMLRGALGKGRLALEQALGALQQNLDSQALFGEITPPALPSLPRNSGDDAALIAAITTIS